MNTIETIACTSCGAVNRAPASKLAAGARPACGSCHQPLFTGEPYGVAAEDEFERLLAKTSTPPSRRLLGALVRSVPSDGAAFQDGGAGS